MKYRCPNCAFGALKITRVTYARQVEAQLVTMPNFAAWRCDACGYTRYDVTALNQVDLLLGPEPDEWHEPRPLYARPVEGPGERGPRRWSS